MDLTVVNWKVMALGGFNYRNLCICIYVFVFIESVELISLMNSDYCSFRGRIDEVETEGLSLPLFSHFDKFLHRHWRFVTICGNVAVRSRGLFVSFSFYWLNDDSSDGHRLNTWAQWLTHSKNETSQLAVVMRAWWRHHLWEYDFLYNRPIGEWLQFE